MRVAHQDEFKEKPIRKYKTNFTTQFALLGVAMAVMLAAAIILAGVLMPIPIPIDQAVVSIKRHNLIPSILMYPVRLLLVLLNHECTFLLALGVRLCILLESSLETYCTTPQ